MRILAILYKSWKILQSFNMISSDKEKKHIWYFQVSAQVNLIFWKCILHKKKLKKKFSMVTT